MRAEACDAVAATRRRAAANGVATCTAAGLSGRRCPGGGAGGVWLGGGRGASGRSSTSSGTSGGAKTCGLCLGRPLDSQCCLHRDVCTSVPAPSTACGTVTAAGGGNGSRPRRGSGVGLDDVCTHRPFRDSGGPVSSRGGRGGGGGGRAVSRALRRRYRRHCLRWCRPRGGLLGTGGLRRL